MNETAYPAEDRELLAQIVTMPRFQKLLAVPKYAWQEFAMVAGVYISFVGATSLYLLNYLPLWAAIAINAVAIYTAFTPFHDAAHSTVSSNRRLNDLLGTISVMPLFPGFTAGLYRFLHLEHHRHTGEESRDPDDIMVTAPILLRPLTWIFIDAYWIYWYLRRWRERSIPELIRDSAGIGFFFVLHAAFLISPYALEFFLLWMIPQRIGITLIAYMFASIQHPAGVIQAEHPIQATRMIRGGNLIRYAFISQSQHLMHHLFPGVPYYRYNDAWKTSRALLESDNEIVWSLAAGKLAMPKSLNDKLPAASLQTVRIAKIEQVSPEVKAFTLVAANADTPLSPYSPGAHLDLHIAPGLIRQYSLCTAPRTDGNSYCIAIKKEAGGRGGSVAAHDQLSVGDEIRVSVPRNHFKLDYDKKGRVILISGGIGITPLISMAEYLSMQGRSFNLHACARSEAAMPFGKALSAAPWTRNTLHTHFDDGAADQLIQPSDLGPWTEGDQLYICGPAGFMSHIHKMAELLGWPEEAIRTESFVATELDNSKNKPFEVVLRKSGVSLEVPANKTLLDILQESRISAAVAVCTQGICGSCKLKVYAGEIEHRDVVLSGAERESGYMTACVSRSAGGRLVLDI